MLVILFMKGVELKFLFLQRTKLIPNSFYSTPYFSRSISGFLIKQFHKENSSPLLVLCNPTVEHSQHMGGSLVSSIGHGSLLLQLQAKYVCCHLKEDHKM